MKKLIFLASTVLLPFHAQALDCASQPNSQAVIQCLNQYGKQLLSENSPVGVQDLYAQELQKKLEDEDLQGLDKNTFESLAQTFKIEIPAVRNSLDVEPKGCFSFGAWDLNTSRLAPMIQEQMKNVAVFLKDFHAQSLGKKSSMLFQIRRVELCSANEKSLNFHRNVLRLNMTQRLIGPPAYTASELMSEWKQGTLVFGPKLNLLEQFVASKTGDTEALIKDRFRLSWLLLNPLGDIRHNLRVAFLKHGSEIRDWLSNGKSANHILEQKSKELGMTHVNLTNDQAQNVIDHFLNKLGEASFVNQISDRVSTYSLKNVDDRNQYAVFMLKNNKQINVDVGAMFTSSYDLSDELKQLNEAQKNEISMISTGTQVGLFAIDLIDQVNVTVKIPQYPANIATCGFA